MGTAVHHLEANTIMGVHLQGNMVVHLKAKSLLILG